jgi:hypothetical protein
MVDSCPIRFVVVWLTKYSVGYEVLTAVVMSSNTGIFRDITPCSPLKVNQRFEGKYPLLLHCRKISRARKQSQGRWQAEPHAGFFLGLFFDPEDGGDMFLHNVG